MEFAQSEQQNKKRISKNEDSIRDLWDNIKCPTICIIVIPEGEEREKDRGRKTYEEIISENFPNLGKETDIQAQEAQRVPNKMNSKEIHTKTYSN